MRHCPTPKPNSSTDNIFRSWDCITLVYLSINKYTQAEVYHVLSLGVMLVEALWVFLPFGEGEHPHIRSCPASFAMAIAESPPWAGLNSKPPTVGDSADSSLWVDARTAACRIHVITCTRSTNTTSAFQSSSEQCSNSTSSTKAWTVEEQHMKCSKVCPVFQCLVYIEVIIQKSA